MKNFPGKNRGFFIRLIILALFQTLITFILLKLFSGMSLLFWVLLFLSFLSFGVWAYKIHSKTNTNKTAEIFSLKDIKPKDPKEDKLEKFRKEYISNISHELKTPVFNVQGYLESLLSTGSFDKDKIRSFIEKALKNAYRLETIIKDLELLSQSDTGNLSLTKDDFDLGHLINEVLEETEMQALHARIKIKSNVPAGQVTVHADRNRIKQVLLNLVSNAIRYNKKNGEVIISHQPAGEKIILKIKDTGIGIKSKHLARIFERFYRVDKARSRKKGGSGLGLAIVKHIMEAHGEQVYAKSKPGEGSEFFITLRKS